MYVEHIEIKILIKSEKNSNDNQSDTQGCKRKSTEAVKQ